jgi:hypothetical protein
VPSLVSFPPASVGATASSAALQPWGVAAGQYQYGGQGALPLVVTQVQLSGYTQLPGGQWVPVNGVRLNPAQTVLTHRWVRAALHLTQITPLKRFVWVV